MSRTQFTGLVIFIVTFFAVALRVNAMEGIYTVIIKKQNEKQNAKKSSRWTLADWLATKKKIALMDQWLALNSSKTWLEIKLAGSTGEHELQGATPAVTSDAKLWSGALFIRMLGFEYDKLSVDDTSGGLSEEESYNAALLILGGSIQSTNLLAHYGQRKTTWPGSDRFTQDFYGARLSLYLLPFLGVQGRYDFYPEEKAQANTLLTLKAQKVTLTPFIEWGALRLKAELATYKRRLFSQGQFSQSAEEKSVLFGLELYL